MKKVYLITSGIVAAILLLIVAVFVTTTNRAISLEEQINGATASIEVQEKRRIDLVYNLVDTVKNYEDYESKTLQQVTAARAKASNGDIEDAKLAINAVAEQYPELKANENYKLLMIELSLTENLIVEQRNNYNLQVEAYNKFVKHFPASAILNAMGYEKIHFTYTEHNSPADAPQDLFSGK